jgi:hypothetical protein
VAAEGAGTELSVRSESIQRLYDLYLSNRFQVNRRYQRKLVWSVEEKQRLIDSITKDLPIPLFLVAELPGAESAYELIDGLQRLNAIFSFIENEFPLNGEYFDLNSLADTKLQLDKGDLKQGHPMLDRGASVSIANYSIALSVFRAPDINSVDEVFRRINSGGRRLSGHELRQAGTTSNLADLVRVLASTIRGDTSPGDIVPLRAMGRLSISNRELAYGVQVDDIFWVREGVLRREDVRESADEQVILDLLVDCVWDPVPSTGSRLRDDYYSYSDLGEEDSESDLAQELSLKIQAYGGETLKQDFLRVYDAIRSILRTADVRFSRLIGLGGGGRAPRYFHAVFIPIYELMISEGMRPRSETTVADALSGIAKDQGPLKVPGGGGDWRAETKRQTFAAVKGVLRKAFEPIPKGESDDLGRYGRATELETLLGNALVEQQLFDCKQGLLALDDERDFADDGFKRLRQTLGAMANAGPQATGYVAVGIADDEDDASRVTELDGTQPVTYRSFNVVGIEREAILREDDLNSYWTWFMQKLRSALGSPFGERVASASRLVSYLDKVVFLLKVSGQTEPVFVDGELFDRVGTETVAVPKSDYMRIYSRFQS